MDSLSHPALLLVDGVSSIGALDFRFDEWKVDVAVTGSQKALSLPTGLAVVAVSPKVGTIQSCASCNNLSLSRSLLCRSAEGPLHSTLIVGLFPAVMDMFL